MRQINAKYLHRQYLGMGEPAALPGLVSVCYSFGSAGQISWWDNALLPKTRALRPSSLCRILLERLTLLLLTYEQSVTLTTKLMSWPRPTWDVHILAILRTIVLADTLLGKPCDRRGFQSQYITTQNADKTCSNDSIELALCVEQESYYVILCCFYY